MQQIQPRSLNLVRDVQGLVVWVFKHQLLAPLPKTDERWFLGSQQVLSWTHAPTPGLGRPTIGPNHISVVIVDLRGGHICGAGLLQGLNSTGHRCRANWSRMCSHVLMLLLCCRFHLLIIWGCLIISWLLLHQVLELCCWLIAVSQLACRLLLRWSERGGMLLKGNCNILGRVMQCHFPADAQQASSSQAKAQTCSKLNVAGRHTKPQ
jgi:hypothetical protein